MNYWEILTAKDWLDFWAKIAATLLAFVGALIGVRWGVTLALKRFQAEKAWELERDTYMKALTAVGVIKYSAGVSFQRERYPSDFPRLSKMLHDAYESAKLEVEKLYSVGPFILSATAIDSLGHLLRRWEGPYADNSLDYYDAILDAAKDCLTTITAEAEIIRLAQPSTRKIGFQQLRKLFKPRSSDARNF